MRPYQSGATDLVGFWSSPAHSRLSEESTESVTDRTCREIEEVQTRCGFPRSANATVADAHGAPAGLTGVPVSCYTGSFPAWTFDNDDYDNDDSPKRQVYQPRANGDYGMDERRPRVSRPSNNAMEATLQHISIDTSPVDQKMITKILSEFSKRICLMRRVSASASIVEFRPE